MALSTQAGYLRDTPPADATVGALAVVDSALVNRFGSGKTTVAFEINTLGDNVVLSPPAGQSIKLYWTGLSTSENNGAEVLVAIRFGSHPAFYRWNLGRPGAFSHWQVIQGAPDESLVINLSDSQLVEVNLTYDAV